MENIVNMTHMFCGVTSLPLRKEHILD